LAIDENALEKATSTMNYQLEQSKLKLMGIGDASKQTLENLFNNPLISKLPNIFTLPHLTLTMTRGSENTIDALKAQILTLEREIENANMSTKKFYASLAQLADLKQKLNDALETPVTKFQKSIATIGPMVSKGIGIIAQAEAQANQAIIDGLDEQKQVAISNIDARIAKTQKGSAEEKRLIEEKAALQKSFDDKIRKAKEEQFAAEKEARVIESIMNTAEEITKVLAVPWLIPIVAGLGLAQTSIIASQPTPKFHTGGMVMPGGSGREFPILVRGGETVRTEAQEREIQNIVNQTSSQSVTNNFYFNTPVDNVEWVKRAVEEGIRRAGLPDAVKYFKNNRNAMTIS
jgi:hypothetical protein